MLHNYKTSHSIFIHFFLLLFNHASQADVFVRDDIVTEPDYTQFSVCHGHGCKNVDQLTLSEDEWQAIASHMLPAAKSAMEERKHIANTIAAFEKIVGTKTNTSNDKAGLFEHMGSPGQLDCIDESTNTTTYLRILDKQGLLNWHKPADRVTRGFFIFGWPHTSAAIDDHNGDKFAVDSWFEDNGIQPHIVAIKKWRSGWEPEI